MVKKIIFVATLCLSLFFPMIVVPTKGAYVYPEAGDVINDYNFEYADQIHNRLTWHNWTIRNDPNESYSYFNNGIWYSKASRHGGDDWADACAGQGKAWHSGDPYSYLGNKYDSMRYVLKHSTYIPVDTHNLHGYSYSAIPDNKVLLDVKFKWFDLLWHSPYWPNIPGQVGMFPTAGLSCMMYFNAYIRDDKTQQCYWLWNYSNPDYWGSPDMFLLEVFPFRKYVDPLSFQWVDALPGNPFFHAYIDHTTHDADLHGIRLEGVAPLPNEWYEFTNYDVGKELRDVAKTWIEYLYWANEKLITVLGFQLMAIALGNEVLCSTIQMQVDYYRIRDLRNQGPKINFWPFKTLCDYGNWSGYFFRPSVDLTGQCISGSIKLMNSRTADLNGDIAGEIAQDNTAPDQTVNVLDLIYISQHFGSYGSGGNYSLLADIKPDKVVNVLDLIIASNNLGKNGTYYSSIMPFNIKFEMEHNGLTYYAWICNVTYWPNDSYPNNFDIFDIPRGSIYMKFYDNIGTLLDVYGQFIFYGNFGNDLE